MSRGEVLIEMTGISKRFPGVQALDCVDLTIRKGEVHALTGENGSGKSTLARVLAGLQPCDAGQILLDGVAVRFQSPADAIAKGIVMISQELTLAPTLSVAENIFLGRLPKTRFGLVDWPRLEREAVAALARLDVHVSPHARVADLSVELRQEVEIARALSTGARLVILDEATSSLSEAATTRLLSLIAKERDKGTAVLMITHRMPEIYAVSKVATVLRDGLLVAEVAIPETAQGELVRLMVGREITDFFCKRAGHFGETVLKVEDLSTPDGALRQASFSLRRGEILGVAGLVGSGKAELGQALGGAIEYCGQVLILGQKVMLGTPRRAIASGIGFVPDDRKASALLLVRSVRENFGLAWLDRLSRRGILNTRRETQEVAAAIATYRVATASPTVAIATLSGGNQQKVILGRTFTNVCTPGGAYDQQAAWIAAKLPAAKVVVVGGPPVPSIQANVACFTNAAKAAGLEVIDQIDNTKDSQANAATIIADELLRKPDVQVFWTYNDASALGVSAAVMGAGKTVYGANSTDGIMIFGLNADPDALTAIKEGRLTGTWDPSNFASGLAMILALQVAMKDPRAPQTPLTVASTLVTYENIAGMGDGGTSMTLAEVPLEK